MQPRLFLLLFATLAVCIVLPPRISAAEAQREIAMEELASRLKLTTEQQAQIAPALEQRNSGLAAIAGRVGPEASAREKVKALREARSIQQEFVGKVSPLLTREQAAEWEKLRAENRERLKARLDR
jgi:hypothetical protein